MKIIIKDEVGPRCVTKEDGQKIYDMIHKPFKAGKTVALDFGGVAQFAAPFFNIAVGQLLKDVEKNVLRRLLQIENINETGRLVAERVIDNADKYHGDVNYREIVDNIIEQQVLEGRF